MTEQQHNALLDKMESTRKKWMAEDGEDADDGDRLLQEAIDMAVKNGKGWAPGEKEEYMKKILDDDYIPPMFCSTQEELEKTGLADAFSALQFDDDPAITMKECKQKGSDAFLNGRKNLAKNIQYYRDAINHYYEAVAWASKIEPLEHKQAHEGVRNPTEDDEARKQREETFETYKEAEIDEIKSTLYSNAALCHIQLKNWGHAKNDSAKAIDFNQSNIKAFYRLAKANQMLKDWEPAGDAIDSGLELDATNRDLLKLKKLLGDKVRAARQARQKREKIRSERAASIKAVWKHCKSSGIRLGRVALVASTTDELEYNEDLLVDDDRDEDAAAFESRWHHHFPHTGKLPKPDGGMNHGQPLWTWPCLLVYPSHSQSDFVQSFHEQEMLAERMAELYPELDDCSNNETTMQWDYNNEFTCSNLAVYFEVNCPDTTTSSTKTTAIHPDSVERLTDMAATMKFYEASRALKGDEGPDIMRVAELVERKRLKRQRKAWKKIHKTLAARPDPAPCVRVHPAMKLEQILKDSRTVVANFLVTLVVIPEHHPAHEAYLKEHKCLGILQPEGN